MRVNSPIVTSTPPTSSMTPAAMMTGMNFSGGAGMSDAGQCKIFIVPCSRKSRPDTMRSTLRSCG